MKTQSVAKKRRVPGHIGKTQLAVIEDLMKGQYKYEVLAKHKVHAARYKRWIENELFKKALRDRIESVRHQHHFLALNSLPIAVEKLNKLISASEKDETARKACLDIIALHKEHETANAAKEAQEAEEEKRYPQLTHAKAAKIWAIMAEPDEPETNQQPVTSNQEQVCQQQAYEPPIPDRQPDREYYAFLNRHPAPASSTGFPVFNEQQILDHEPNTTNHQPERPILTRQPTRNEIEADLAIQKHASNVRSTWRQRNS